MQSWCLYESTYKLIDNPLNGKKMTQILEVHTTSDFTYNGEVYNIDNYKNLITNKDVKIIQKIIDKTKK